MMKSPTSLIRFRNAVGVMLAMSALFAVVLSAITITQDRALGQTTPSATRSFEFDVRGSGRTGGGDDQGI